MTGSASFDGSANASITTTIADDSHNHVISNIDNLQSTLNNKINYGSTCHNFSTFTGSNKLYLAEIHDCFFAATKRWTVEGSYTGASSGTYSLDDLERLFDKSYESYVVIPKGCVATFKITFGSNYFPGYPYGNYFIHYYNTMTPDVASIIKVYCNYAS